MRVTDVVIVGAGQAGLATSHCLSARGIDHIVLDRGRVAERWRSERWDSLRLLTPNWQSRLPGYAYRGPAPDGYMSMHQVVAYFERYAALSRAPVQSHTRVLRIDPHLAGYCVHTDRGDYFAGQVVLATGHCDVPHRADLAERLPGGVQQLASTQYRNPARLPAGGVLVVGASASGAQIADELARSGRPVTLAVGRHTRLPRRYRGMDILWWLERTGKLAERIDPSGDSVAARAEPSLQLIGSAEGRDLNLVGLRQQGVRLCGRLVDIDGNTVRFAEDLLWNVRRADRKLDRLLHHIDARAPGVSSARSAVQPLAPLLEGVRPPPSLDLARARISTVIWATGFRRDYSWLRVPVLDRRGEIVQQGGITPADGLYTMGLRFQRTRKSSFIDGVASDAEHIARHIASRLGLCARPAA